jgi:hypothetical protein
VSVHGSRTVFAEFTTADELLDALVVLRERGFTDTETYTPYEVPGLSERLGLRRSRLPWLVFGAGLIGAIGSYAVQWYTNVWSYPQNAGGRPPHAVPAFLLSTFEGMVLLAALAAVGGFLLFVGLPRLAHPVHSIPEFHRASLDRFWVEVRGLSSAIAADEVGRLLTENRASHFVIRESDR